MSLWHTCCIRQDFKNCHQPVWLYINKPLRRMVRSSCTRKCPTSKRDVLGVTPPEIGIPTRKVGTNLTNPRLEHCQLACDVTSRSTSEFIGRGWSSSRVTFTSEVEAGKDGTPERTKVGVGEVFRTFRVGIPTSDWNFRRIHWRFRLPSPTGTQHSCGPCRSADMCSSRRDRGVTRVHGALQ